ncbi:MAG TPA: hypothetical protein VKY74_05695 [Chloroflexia bacterium]|nr:hypothetical protein [Chloroflexia bacterium]
MRNTCAAARLGLTGALLLVLLLTLAACGRPAGPGQSGPTPTGAPSPTPAGAGATPSPTANPTPSDPYSLLDPLSFFDPSTGVELVKADLVDLDGQEPKKVLLTINAPPLISGTNVVPLANLSYTNTMATLAVLGYDTTAHKWQILNHTPDPGIPGRAAPLPASSQGQNLLRMNPALPILQLRTATTPTLGSGVPSITLSLYSWQDGTIRPLHKRPAGAAADEDARFTGAADVQLVDIDNDGRAEVVVDDGKATTIWKWDGTRFIPR